MQNLAHRISTCLVPDGHVAVFWLGQAGFIFKTSDGILVAVDPYLSNCCERYFGFKRLMPYMIGADDITFDLLIVTHAHYDHFDVDSIPTLLGKGHTHLITAMDGKLECERLNLSDAQITYMKHGDTVADKGIQIQAVPCDHGDMALDAVGLLLTISCKKIYITGDTAYRPDLFENPAVQGVDLLIAPINGAFGNMNEEQAAQAASLLIPKIIIPCHFWNFAEHGGDPGKFAEKMKQVAPNIPYTLMKMGGMLLF